MKEKENMRKKGGRKEEGERQAGREGKREREEGRQDINVMCLLID